MNQLSLTDPFKRSKKEFRILIREDRIGDFKEFFSLMFISQISNRFVDPLSSPLPVKISTKKAVINMKNNDDQCFKWSVVRALNPVDIHPERVSKELKDQSERLVWSGLKFPVKLDQIVVFEQLNPQISINVFGFEGVVYPLRLSKRKKRTARAKRERANNQSAPDF